MPVLTNPRHEAFAQALAKGKTQEEAYTEAGFAPSRHHASRLATNGNVAKRVEEIQARVAVKAEWSAADRLASLKAIHDASMADDRRTAISAISEANKMQGSYAPAKREVSGPNGGPINLNLSGMTDEQLAALEAALGAVTDAAGGSAGYGEDGTPEA